MKVKQSIEECISTTIKRNCSKELDICSRDGIDREPLAMMLTWFAMDAMKGGDPMTQIRDQGAKAKQMSRYIEKVIRNVRGFVSRPGRLPPSSESPTGMALLGMEYLAQSWREDSRLIGKSLRRNGRKDHGGVYEKILGWILRCNPHFKRWAALSRLLDEGFRAVGFDEAECERLHLSPGGLKLTAKRYSRRGPGLSWKEMEAEKAAFYKHVMQLRDMRQRGIATHLMQQGEK